MLKKGTPGKYSLRAGEPRSRRPLVENYAMSDEVDAGRAFLERAGYTVIVTLAETHAGARLGRGPRNNVHGLTSGDRRRWGYDTPSAPTRLLGATAIRFLDSDLGRKCADAVSAQGLL